MKKYITLASCLSSLLVASCIIGWPLTWFQVPGTDWLAGLGFDGGRYATLGGQQINLANLPQAQRLAGFVIDGVGIGLICAIWWQLQRILKIFRSGEYFSPSVVGRFYNIGKLVLSSAVYGIAANMLLSLVYTLHNPAGQRVITLSIGNSDLLRVMAGVLFLLLMAIMKEGSKLENEHKLVI